MAKAPILFCDDGAEIALPFTWAICSACSGDGKSSAHLGAFTQSDMDEQGPGFLEDYMSGFYDQTCDRCDGLGRVKVADHKRMTKEQRDEYADQRKADREIAAIERMERMMGA